MASKKTRTKSTKKKSGYYPVVRSTKLTSVTENIAVGVLDVSKELSKLNRRLYRQGRLYSVRIKQRAASPDTISVYALRNDWAVQKGLQMAYAQYVKNTADERGNLSGKQLARWEDFRVDHGVRPAGGTRDLLSQMHNFGTVPANIGMTAGEFELSTVVDASNAEKTFTWAVVPNPNEFGILIEYDKSGNMQVNPAAQVNDLAYAEIDSENSELTHDALQDHGDSPPYAANRVNENSPWVLVDVLQSSAGGAQRASTGYFDAPCGLVVLTGSGATTWDTDSIQFEVKAGDYKGVHAPSMLE